MTVHYDKHLGFIIRLCKGRQPSQHRHRRDRIRQMDARKQFSVVSEPEPDGTQVFHSSIHQAVSLRPVVAPVSTEMQGRDLFPMTQIPWARSSFAVGPAADQQTSAVYREHGQPMFPPQLPHDLPQPPQPSHQPRPDIRLMLVKSVNPDPCPNNPVQQHHQQHPQQQQEQKLTASAVPQSSSDGQAHGTGMLDVEYSVSPVNSKTGQKGNKRKHTASGSTNWTDQKKRCSNPLEWKKKKKKTLRDRGEEYTTVQGKLKKAKNVQPIDCSKCRFRCSEKIPEEVRQTIHELYWSLASYERQRAFIAQHVEQNNIKQVRSKTESRREVANSFFFVHNRKEHRVCKAFFTKTLDITSKVVDYTMKKTKCGVYVGQDERGRRVPVNKTKAEDLEFIHWHIGSFPIVDTSSSSSKGKKSKNRKRYLSQDLNVGRLYSMYKDLCEQTGRKAVGISVYRNIFNKDFNLAFQKPKKEHCANCKCAEGSGKSKTKSACHTNSANNSSNNGQSVSSAQPSLFFQ